MARVFAGDMTVSLGPILTELSNLHDVYFGGEDDPMSDFYGYYPPGPDPEDYGTEARAIVRKHGLEPALFNDMVKAATTRKWVDDNHHFAIVAVDEEDRWAKATHSEGRVTVLHS